MVRYGTTRVLLVSGLVPVLALSLLATAAVAQPGPGGRGGLGARGGPGGNFDPTQMMYTELAWSACNFQCTLSDQQFNSLRIACQKASDARRAVWEKARQSGQRPDPAAMRKAMDSTRAALDQSIGKILSKAQLNNVRAWETLAKSSLGKIMKPGSGADPASMMSLFYIDQTWAGLAFRVKLTNAQMKALRPTFAKAWDSRKAALKTGDAKKVGAAVTASQKTIEAKLKSTLTKDQLAKLAPPRGEGRGGKGGKGGKRR